MSEQQIILITGASSGFGALAARALSHSGHTVYAGMRATTARNAPQVQALNAYASTHSVKLHAVEMDVVDQASIDNAIAHVITASGHIDVLIHNAGHMSCGPAEAFTPAQFAQLFDINVLSTQRVNRAALPHMRRRGKGLLVWISSSSTRGGTPPFLAPYFAAKAAMDSVAVSYSTELALWGIETCIVVPGAFTSGTNHFTNSGSPEDTAVVAEYEEGAGPYVGIRDKALGGLAALEPPGTDVKVVADEIVRVIGLPMGERPFRTHVDPTNDGCEVVNEVADRMRTVMYQRIGLEELLKPKLV
ncbi:short-chain alcohol dehydrogenase [Geopyxis carbonaria]|nr:short-chain alcohol dehydrogenase [Geopyxis carbonaria]